MSETAPSTTSSPGDLSDEAAAFSDLGVLMPLRMETLFDRLPEEPEDENAEESEQWQLSLRVIPQPPSIVRHDRHITDHEKSAAADFWRMFYTDSDTPQQLDYDTLASEEGRRAFEELGRRVGLARAAWLVEVAMPKGHGDGLTVQLPADMPANAEPNRVVGLPPILNIVGWTHVDGREQRFNIGELTGVADTIPLPTMADRDDVKLSWVTSFESACKVGLGGVFSLPKGVTPTNLAGIAVAGVGDSDPGLLFADQAYGGELSAVALGTATTSVSVASDEPPHPNDVQGWHQTLLDRLRPSASENLNVLDRLSPLLTSSTSAHLAAFPGSASDAGIGLSQIMVRALWPALWGEWLLEVYSGKELVAAGLGWAAHHLYPEGPLPPLRFDDQPYGLLPVTLLDCHRGPHGSSVDDEMVRRLAIVLGQIRETMYARIPRQLNSDRDSSNRRFRRSAVATGFRTLDYGPPDVILGPYGLNTQESRDLIRQAYELAAGLGGVELKNALDLFPDPGQRDGMDNPMPLVQPTKSSYLQHSREVDENVGLPVQVESIVDLFDQVRSNTTTTRLSTLFDWFGLDPVTNFMQRKVRLRNLPDSLLIRTLLHAYEIGRAWENMPPSGVHLIPPELFLEFQGLLADQTEASREIARMLHDPGLPNEVHPEITDPVEAQQHRELAADPATGKPLVWLELPPQRRRDLERAFGATLDAAGQRLDPWVTALAMDRIEYASAPRRPRLGAYGWVEGPFIGDPGPTETGRLHAPSHEQMVTATILRDQFLSAEAAGIKVTREQQPWQMDLTSRSVRLAAEISADIRFGLHPWEALGTRIERIVSEGRPAAAGHQRVLKLREACPMFDDEKHPRQVCQGDRALHSLLNGSASLPIDLSLDETKALRELDSALDAYADLQLADGIALSTSRRANRANTVMNGLAGVGPPPELAFTSTPPSGHTINTTVLTVLPHVVAPPDPAPIRLVDASLADFLDHRFSGEWGWELYDPKRPGVLHKVSRSELGLNPAELIVISDDLLAGVVRRKATAANAAQLVDAVVIPPPELLQCRKLSAILGVQPATTNLLGPTDSVGVSDLSERLQVAKKAIQIAINDLGRARSDDQADWQTALRLAVSWTALPAPSPTATIALECALAGSDDLPQDADPRSVCGEAEAILHARLTAQRDREADRAKKDADSQPGPHPDATAVMDLVADLRSLVCPGTQFGVLIPWVRDDLIRATGLDTTTAQSTLDADWLTLMATTRPSLTRLEASQLAGSPLTAWTSSPGDPWQTSSAASLNVRKRKDGERGVSIPQTPRLTAAYGPSDVWTNQTVAVGLLDDFTEVIPQPERDTWMAFGFNAPAARAQQAILLAAAPYDGHPLDATTLHEILAETRMLIELRTASPALAAPVDALMPTPLMSIEGDRAIDLDPVVKFL